MASEWNMSLLWLLPFNPRLVGLSIYPFKMAWKCSKAALTTNLLIKTNGAFFKLTSLFWIWRNQRFFLGGGVINNLLTQLKNHEEPSYFFFWMFSSSLQPVELQLGILLSVCFSVCLFRCLSVWCSDSLSFKSAGIKWGEKVFQHSQLEAGGYF